MPDWIAGLLVTLLKAVLVALGLLTAFAYMTLIERRLLGRMQLRPGPNRVGPLGLLQPVADAIKSIFKEDLTVTLADKVVFTLAPILAIGMAITITYGATHKGLGWPLEIPRDYVGDTGMLNSEQVITARKVLPPSHIILLDRSWKLTNVT